MIGRFATFESSSVTCPSQPGSMKPAVEWMSRPRRPERALPLEPGDEVVGQPDALERRAEHELARVQDERVLAVDLDELGQLRLLDLDVDVGIAVVVEDPEEPVDADVDARRLEQRGVVRVDLDAALRDGAGDRRVGEDHGGDSTGYHPGSLVAIASDITTTDVRRQRRETGAARCAAAA